MQRNKTSTPAASSWTTGERSKTSWGRSTLRNGSTSCQNSRAERALTRSGMRFTTTGRLIVSIPSRYRQTRWKLGGHIAVASRLRVSHGRSRSQDILRARLGLMRASPEQLSPERRKHISRRSDQRAAGPGGNIANQLFISHVHGGASPQVGNLAHAHNGMRQIEPSSDVGMRKDGGVFDHGAAIHVCM